MSASPRNPFICTFKKISAARVPVCGIHDFTAGLRGATNRVESETCEACWVNDSLDQHPCEHLVPRTLIAEERGGFKLMDVRWVCQAYKVELETLAGCATSCPKWRKVGEGEAASDERDVDGLTGLFNRRWFDERLSKELAFSTSSLTPLVLLLGDIDDFKRVNDTYGHVSGDDVLKFVAATMKAAAGHKAVVCRYGGEELAAILPNYLIGEALPLAERIRGEVEAYPFTFHLAGEETPARVTLSLGLAALDRRMKEPRDLIAEADRCLYAAKRAGKNRVVAREVG